MDKISNDDFIQEIMCILSSLSQDDKFICEKLVAHDIMRYLVIVLSNSNFTRETNIYAIRIIGNMMYRNDETVNVI